MSPKPAKKHKTYLKFFQEDKNIPINLKKKKKKKKLKTRGYPNVSDSPWEELGLFPTGVLQEMKWNLYQRRKLKLTNKDAKIL